MRALGEGTCWLVSDQELDVLTLLKALHSVRAFGEREQECLPLSGGRGRVEHAQRPL